MSAFNAFSHDDNDYGDDCNHDDNDENHDDDQSHIPASVAISCIDMILNDIFHSKNTSLDIEN